MKTIFRTRPLTYPRLRYCKLSRRPFLWACLLFGSGLANVVFASPTAIPPLPDSSLYQLESHWLNDKGDTLTLSQFRGKPRLLTLFFSRCESVCPMLLGQLKLLERDMPTSLRERIGFVMITFDTQRDSLKALREYREHMGLDPAHWTLLRSSADNTRELALLLGVEYQQGANGQMDHNGLIALLDSDGRVIQKVSGISDRPAFIKAMQSLARKSPGLR